MMKRITILLYPRLGGGGRNPALRFSMALTQEKDPWIFCCSEAFARYATCCRKDVWEVYSLYEIIEAAPVGLEKESSV